MNKETTLILNYIKESRHYLDKILKIRQKFENSKDFFNQFSYIIQEIVNEEKKFINMSRKNIELPELSQMFFEKTNS